MNKELDFRFYSVLKNEDAPTYLSDNLIVAADGLGGSGSTVHEINRRRHQDIAAELDRCAFGDLEGEAKEALRDYISELVEPMADDKDDTSALWASRIVIARFVYALIADDKYSFENIKDASVRNALTLFVKEGLYSTARHFGLEAGRISGQILLPTTLCAARFDEGKDAVRVEVMWAGDSRVYAFTKSGLRLLSRDDEDESGSVTNLFDGREGKKTTLNYRVYEIEKPCAVMTVSDGIFDPFSPNDNMGVEDAFLGLLKSSESVEEWRGKLIDAFDRIHGDDATVAFRAFGFDSFADFKKAYEKRTEEISKITDEFSRMKKILQVLEYSEDDVRSYVRQRTLDKYAKVATAIMELYSSDTPDVVTDSGFIAENLAGAEDFLKAEAEKKRKEQESVKFDELLEMLYEIPENISEVFVKENLTKLENDLVETVLKKASNHCKAKKDLATSITSFNYRTNGHELAISEIKKKIEELTAAIEEMVRVYAEGVRLSAFAADEDTRPVSEDKLASKCYACRVERSCWKLLLKALETESFDIIKALRMKSNLSKKKLNDAEGIIQKLCATRNSVSLAEGSVVKTRETYREALRSLLTSIQCGRASAKVFKPEYSSIISSAPAETSVCVDKGQMKLFLEKLLTSEKERVVDGIVDTLAANPTARSQIDSCYNATRLDTFREYYRLQSIPKTEFEEFSQRLVDLENEYLSLEPVKL